MAKDGSGLAAPDWQARRSSVNAGAPLMLSPQAAAGRVLGIQGKLHKWASDDQDRGFSDLHNLVCDPATLLVAGRRVRGNRGSRSAGIDGQTADEIETRHGVERFLGELREELRAGTFGPLAVKERAIPKARRQAALPGNPDGPRPCRAGRPQTGTGTDLRGRFPAVLLRVFGPDAERRTRSLRSSTSPSALMSGSWRATSRPALTASTTRP